MKKIFTYWIGFSANLEFVPKRIKDIFMWPLASRVLGSGYLQVVYLKDGFAMYGSMEDILSRIILFLGPFRKNLWEPSTSILLEKLSRDATNIVIAGSHVGYLVLKSANATKGYVHAFEPIEHLYERSRENFDLNPHLQESMLTTYLAKSKTILLSTIPTRLLIYF